MDVTTKSLEITLAPSILGPEVAKLSAEERLVLIEAFARRAMADGRLPQTENELGSGSTGVAKLTPRQALALDLLTATAVAANVDADALDAAIPKDAVFAATVALVSSTVSSTVSAKDSSKEPSTTTRLLALHAALVVKHHSAFSRSRCVSAAASIAAALESNSNSNLNDDGPRRRDLALMFFETRDFAKALIHFNKLKQLNYAVPERDLQRLETIHAICRKLAASSSNSTASAPSTPKQPNTSVPNTPSSSFASLSSPLLSLAAFRARNDYGPAFITLILNDWKDRVIPLQLRTKVLPDFLYLSHPDCALKLSFLNALFEAVDYDLASTLSRKQSVQSNSSNFSLSNSKSVSDSQNTYTDDAVFARMQTHLPPQFYALLKQPPTALFERINSLLALLSKFTSMLLLSHHVGANVRGLCSRFTARMLVEVGNAEALRGITKSDLLGVVDFDAAQRVGWMRNAEGVGFSVRSFTAPVSAPFVPMVVLKRKLMTSLTLGDLAEVGKHYEAVSVPIIIAAAQRFIEKNQFQEAHAFLNACPSQLNQAGIHVKILVLMCEELDDTKDTMIAFGEIYNILMTFLVSCPQIPADAQTCRLALTVALKRSNDESSTFLEQFVVKAEESFQNQLYNNKPFEAIKLLVILGKVCRQLVRTYRVLMSGLTSPGELHSLDLLHMLQEAQIMEVRNLAKELVACLAPGMQEAKFVKEVQAQLISMLRAAKNEEFIWLVGALVGGFTSGLQPPGTRVQLRNFGPIAYLVCPTEIVAAEDEPWSGRIASINKNQNDLTPFLKIDGGYLVKFLLSLYTIPSANPSPASIFCLGDLSFSIGDYANATKQYLHGLSMQSGHFTDMVAILDPYLGNKGWNQRLGQCLQITGRFLGAAVVMQMVKDSVDGVVMVDFQSACVALDAVVEGLVGDDPEEVEGLLVYLYDMTLLEYVTYLLKRKSKTESMKVAVRLIGRRELGYGVDDLVKQQYVLRLKQRFLKDLAAKVINK